MSETYASIKSNREFEIQRMKEPNTIKDYSNKLINIANKVRLLGFNFSYSRIV
jgi:hypothetical protein